jgi:hypothetical protein
MQAPAVEVSFRSVVLLLPLATALHVLEEWPRFPRWARRFASPAYTDREYVITHLITLLGSTAVGVLLWTLLLPWLVAVFFLFWIGPGIFWNGLFHVGATVLSRSYCAGAVTGTLLYVPLSATLALLSVRENLLSPTAVFALFVLAAGVHTLEVGHNVFKRW